MAGSFAHGFATGFINERNRRLDAEKEDHQISLRSRLDFLAKQQDKWDEQAKRDKEIEEQAKYVDKMMPGHYQAARDAIKGGYTVQEYMKDIGPYTKIKKPTQTTLAIPNTEAIETARTNKIPVPAGVDPTAQAAGLNATTVVAANQTGEIDNSQIEAKYPGTTTNSQPYDIKGKPVPGDGTSPDDAKINDIDAEIKKTMPWMFHKEEPRVTPDKLAGADAGYEYTPPEKEIKLGTRAEEQVKYEDMVQRGDTLGAQKQKRNLEIMDNIARQEALNKAAGEGKNLVPYVVLNKNKMRSRVLIEEGPNGETFNPDTHKKFVLGQNESLHRIDEETDKRITKVREDFGKRSDDYVAQSEAVAGSFDPGAKMIGLLNKHGDMMVDTGGNLLQVGLNIETDIKSLAQAVENANQDVRTLINDDKTEPTMISAALANYEAKVKELEKQSTSGSILGDKNAQIAMDRTLYENYQRILAFKWAAAQGETAGRMSNADVERALRQTGYGVKQAAGVVKTLQDNFQLQVQNNDLKRKNLDYSVEPAVRELGFDPDLRGRRLEEMISPEAIPLFRAASGQAARADAHTLDQKNLADQQAAQPTMPTFTADNVEAGFAALKSGDKFIGPDGKVRVKP